MNLIEYYNPPQNDYVGPYAWFQTEEGTNYVVLNRREPIFNMELGGLIAFVSQECPVLAIGREEINDLWNEDIPETGIELRAMQVSENSFHLLIDCEWSEFIQNPEMMLTKAML